MGKATRIYILFNWHETSVPFHQKIASFRKPCIGNNLWRRVKTLTLHRGGSVPAHAQLIRTITLKDFCLNMIHALVAFSSICDVFSKFVV